MNIVIHTFETAPQERRDNAEAIKAALDNTATVYVGGTSTCNNWINILKANKNDSLLLLEDDVELSGNFLDKVEEYINQYPSFVLNFYFNEGNNTTKLIPANRYTWNQCVYFPKDLVPKLIKPSEEFIKSYPYFVRKNDYAIQIRHALCKNNVDFYAIEPKLVKHLNFTSTLRDRPVITQNFIDDGVSDE